MVKTILKMICFNYKETKITILRDVSGLIKPSRMTLLLGPRLWQNTLSWALAGSLDHSLQIISVLQHSMHIMETTLLVSLLQPVPEIFNLFDEIIIMAEGRIIYHGPCDCVFEFFENCADFLAEVISKKDQAQYWAHYGQPYHYVSVEQFAELFKEHYLGQKLSKELSQPCSFLRSCKGALSFTKYSTSKKQLLRACTSREWLLVKRNLFVYAFKSIQVSPGPENISVGEQIMRRRGLLLLFEGYFYWISLGALFGFFVLFNIVSTIALTYLGRPSKSRPQISPEKISNHAAGLSIVFDLCHTWNAL